MGARDVGAACRDGPMPVSVAEVREVIKRIAHAVYYEIEYRADVARSRRASSDVWSLPSVVRARGWGDCDDMTNLANDDLLIALPELRMAMVVGTVPVRTGEGGHAWSEIEYPDGLGVDWFDATWGRGADPPSVWRRSGRLPHSRRRYTREDGLGPREDYVD